MSSILKPCLLTFVRRHPGDDVDFRQIRRNDFTFKLSLSFIKNEAHYSPEEKNLRESGKSGADPITVREKGTH